MAQDAVSAIGLQAAEMTTSYRKFLLFSSQCRLGSAMEADWRDSIHPYYCRPSIDFVSFWFIVHVLACYVGVTSLLRGIIFNNPAMRTHVTILETRNRNSE